MRNRLIFALILPLMVAGCKTASAPTPPAPPLQGACNSTDADIYRTLIFAQGSILNLNATIRADEVTDPTTANTLKPYAQQAATDYNIAEATWQGYHAACISNPSLSAVSAQAAVNKLTSDLQTVPGGK